MKPVDSNLIKQTIRNQWRSYIFLCGLLVLFSLLNIWVIGIMNTNDAMNHLIKQMPSIFKSMIGADDVRHLTNQHFILLTYTHPFPLVIILSFSIGLASRALAGEIETGTMELLLSRAITRSQIVISIILILVLGTFFMTLAVYFGLSLGAHRFDILYPPMIFHRIWLNFYLFHLALAAISLGISSLCSERSRVISSVVGLLLVMFFMDFFSRSIDALEILKYATIFTCFGPMRILMTRALNWHHLTILGAVILLGFGFSLLYFRRRDILK